MNVDINPNLLKQKHDFRFKSTENSWDTFSRPIWKSITTAKKKTPNELKNATMETEKLNAHIGQFDVWKLMHMPENIRPHSEFEWIYLAEMADKSSKSSVWSAVWRPLSAHVGVWWCDDVAEPAISPMLGTPLREYIYIHFRHSLLLLFLFLYKFYSKTN